MNKTFEDFKKEISIVDLAIKHGYVINRTAGLKWPVLVNTEFNDSIIVNPAHKLFRDKYDTSIGGNLIKFIQDRANTVFANFNRDQDPSKPFTVINKVCNSFLNLPEEEKKDIKNHIPENIRNNTNKANFFTLDALNVTALTDPYYLVKQRCIDPSVLKDPIFSSKLINQNIELENGSKLTNTGFLYTRSILNEKAVGIEIRNQNFKRHSPGSDRSSGLGFSSLTENPVKNIVIAESFIDMLSYHQLHGDKNNLYVSTGGHLTSEQIHAIINTPSDLEVNKKGEDVKFTLAFDNDISGNSYDLEVIRHLSGGMDKPLPIMKVFPKETSSDNYSLLFYSSEKTTAIKSDLFNLLKGINKEIKMDWADYNPGIAIQNDKLFTMTENMGGQNDYKIEFPKNFRYLELMNQCLIKVLGLTNKLTIHKSQFGDFNDDLQKSSGRKVEDVQKQNETVKIDFNKIKTSLKL